MKNPKEDVFIHHQIVRTDQSTDQRKSDASLTEQNRTNNTHTKIDIRVIVRVVRTLAGGFRLLEILLASHLGLLSVASAHGCCRC